MTKQQLIQNLRELENNLKKETADQKALQLKYFGKKGLFTLLAKEMKKLDQEDKREVGNLLNLTKKKLEYYLHSFHGQKVINKKIDLTIPGIKPQIGHVHPISLAMKEITEIFEKVGFTRVRYPEVDWDFFAFESLNMPKDHPARDEWETFIINPEEDKKMGKIVLTPHTSNGQVREMLRLKSKPPIRMINIARCYRRQQDATHTQMFHQFEGLVVDKGINIQHLKGTIDYFARQFYGSGVVSRIRPFHFKFTEPSFEVDFSCQICAGTGVIDEQNCKFCKSGWHEVGGAGMVHPNVLKAGGIDPDIYTGFAFGWGIERTYSLKKDLHIDDIRLIYGTDLRFLKQF